MSSNARALLLVARHVVGRAVAGLVVLLLGYGVAGLIGGTVPVNAAWRAPETGVTIWVESNGVHTGLVMPKVAGGVDWRSFAPSTDLGDPAYGGNGYLAIGWGDRDFYLGTPTWADVRPRTVWAAAWGSERTLLHVEHVPVPAAGDDVRAIVLRPAEYRRLVAFIVASRVAGGGRWRGYGAYDVFYEARGRYDAVRTCNSWTGAALAAAGVRVGWWTPFPVTVSWWFRHGTSGELQG